MAKRILLIEDSPTQALSIQYSLVNKGYSVEIAADGEQGIAIAAQLKPDLIILDMHLPNMDGLEVCRTLKTDAMLRSITVVMFSQENKLHNINKAYEAGADCFVAKNDVGDEVLASVVEMAFVRKAAAIRRAPARPLLSQAFR